MATVIKLKKSETASDAPTTSDLVAGEKKLSILQDLNTDDTIDQDSILSAFSPVFTIE